MEDFMKNDFLIESPHYEKFGTFNFLHTDSEELFKKNKKILGPNWHYYNNPIFYNMNQLGYRMNKEMHEVDYDNYIAFFGCSYTVGIGLPLEYTFPYLISERANCDYVNGAVGGCSPDFMFTNFLHFFERVPKKPKCFVFVWPEITRTFYWYNNTPVFMLANASPNTEEVNYWSKAYKAFIMEDSHLIQRISYIRSAIKIICESNKIPYYETTFYVKPEREPYLEKFKIPTVDLWHPILDAREIDAKTIHYNWARDLISLKKGHVDAHQGIFSHQSLTDTFFSKLGILFND
jgi:hypothetical protein